MKYKAVIFDLFGTLVDNYNYEEYQSTLRQMASVLTIPFDAFSRLWSETAHERSIGIIQTIEANIEFICQKLGVSADEIKVTLATNIRFNFIANTMRSRQDDIDVLSCLKSQGLKLGLISNCSPETPVIWRDSAFFPLFDVALFSCCVKLKKPDPRIYHLASEQLVVKPDNCLYIGDGDSQELAGAASVGMCPVLIRLAWEDSTQSHLVNRERWNGSLVSSLKEVSALLQRVKQRGEFKRG